MTPTAAHPAEDILAARRWLGLALAVLVAAGAFALAVVIGRMPPFDRLVGDPLFFKRCLVAHVNLALVAWFYCFLGALLALVSRGRVARAAAWVAGAGVALLLGGAVAGGRPILSNYIPTLEHPWFQLGQLALGAGVLLLALDPGVWRGRAATLDGPGPDAAARAFLRGAAIALVLAALTFAASAASVPAGTGADLAHELRVWGVGHVLQLVSALGLVAVWLMLLRPVLGESPLSARGATLLCVAMVLPWTPAPLLALGGAAHREAFTQLMQWTLFPPITVAGVLCGAALARGFSSGRLPRRAASDLRVSAFAVSAALTLLGFGLGAAIRGSNTMVPAHYHASVGAVTVAFMAATYPLLAAFGRALPTARLRRAAALQPVVYGAGMLVFASGFAVAGARGMDRKVYGAEQAARGAVETAGLFLMGAGGFIAIAGGLLFLGIVAAAWWRGVDARDPNPTGLPASPWRIHLGREPG